jgi:beta-glucanase (GH16 family)
MHIKTGYILSMLALGVFTSCETAEVPRLMGSDVVIAEGNTTYTYEYEIALDQPAPKTLTFDYTTTELTALEGEDFTASSGTVTIEKGESTALIPIQILGDEEAEQSENFWIAYQNGENVNIPNPFNAITLENDDNSYNQSDSGYTTPLSYPGFTLVWADEFDGAQLNTSDWNYETGASGWGNQESQYYRSGTSNCEVKDGYLIITAKQENYSGAPFTSARITTQNKQSFKYGRIDIRARLPFGQGLWPALWMLGDNITTVGWPSCGELDIMELIGGDGLNDRTVHGTAHWNAGGQASHSGSKSLPDGKFADQFHVFSLVWDQGSIKWYVDDVLYHNLNTTSLSAFHEKHFFIFNIAVEGDWPGPINSSTIFPQFMAVDYVRVFQ